MEFLTLESDKKCFKSGDIITVI